MENSNILIAYFSHVGENVANYETVVLTKGNTEVVAEKIQALTGGDLYRIEEAVPYPTTYRECNNRARDEDYDNARPEIKDKLGVNMTKYDTIYLGFPIWYRTFPRIIATFVEKYNLEGKAIIPFCTNDEEFFGLSLLELQAIIKGAELKPGLVVRGVNVNSADKEIENFVKANS